SAVVGLLAAECLARRRREPALALEDYLRRFPDYRAELESLAFPGRETHRDEARTGPLPHRQPDPTAATRLPAVPGFEVLGELGRGAMGVVYEAVQQKLNRRVALKMILDADHAEPGERDRFRREAEALARLQH